MGEYKDERKIVIALQDYQHTDPSDEYVFQTRLLLNEYDSNGSVIGRNEIPKSNKEDVSYWDYSSLITSYLKGTSLFVQKAKSALILDQGNQHIRAEGIAQYIEKCNKALETQENPIYKERDKLVKEWLKMFYLPLDKNPTVKEFVEYLDSISEEKLLDWAKREIKNIADVLDPEWLVSSVEEYIVNLLNDHVLSNDSWATGFFEDPAFDEDNGEYVLYLPCVVGDYLERQSTYRIDDIMKKHQEEIIEYVKKGE